jgi:hypothetical protein
MDAPFVILSVVGARKALKMLVKKTTILHHVQPKMYDKFSNRNFGAKICRFDFRLELTREENVAQEFEVRSKSYDRAKRNNLTLRPSSDERFSQAILQ